MKSTQENSLRSSVPSDNYRDYVIKDKRLVGRFDDMYRHAAEIPWHQDETANAIFSDLTVTLLRRRSPTKLARRELRARIHDRAAQK